MVDLCLITPIKSNRSNNDSQSESQNFDSLILSTSQGGDASPATEESKERKGGCLQDPRHISHQSQGNASSRRSSSPSSITASAPMFLMKKNNTSPSSEPIIITRDSNKGISIAPSALQSPTSRDGREGGRDGRRFVPSDLNRMVMILTAELRKCTILFINIKVNVSLVFSPGGIDRKFSEIPSCHRLKSLPFIARSVEERAGDEKVLSALQKCMEITSTTLTENGGQIRQFIHDDKGTVCIGTIGLRGSTTEDNSAAAVEAARSIIAQLQEAGLDASIGVASGKAFCGLVGSSVRHEYAVMGPCVNLSARLMCAAEMGTILCDQKTMETDRRHRYEAKSAITAKGFDAPVSIFRPLTNNMQGRCSAPGSSRMSRGRSPSLSRMRGIPSSSSLSTLLISTHHHSPHHKTDTHGPTHTQGHGHGHESNSSSDDESGASTDEAFGMGYESGLFGRAPILSKIYSFFSPDDAPFSRLNSRDDSMKCLTACVETSSNSKVEDSTPKVIVPQKMKLVIVSGPYGIGKSSVLKTVYQKIMVSSSAAVSNITRFKYITQASSYNKTTPFNIWKKALTHLLSVLHFNTYKISGNDLTFPKLAHLCTVPEDGHLSEKTSSAAAALPTEYFKRATIVSRNKLSRVSKKQSTIVANIHRLVMLLDPSLRDLEPLLFNGFLSK